MTAIKWGEICYKHGYEDRDKEIVRCKDCVNSVCIPRNIGEDWFCDIKYNEWGELWATSPEGFCDVGERGETE